MYCSSRIEYITIGIIQLISSIGAASVSWIYFWNDIQCGFTIACAMIGCTSGIILIIGVIWRVKLLICLFPYVEVAHILVLAFVNYTEYAYSGKAGNDVIGVLLLWVTLLWAVMGSTFIYLVIIFHEKLQNSRFEIRIIRQ